MNDGLLPLYEGERSMSPMSEYFWEDALGNYARRDGTTVIIRATNELALSLAAKLVPIRCHVNWESYYAAGEIFHASGHHEDETPWQLEITTCAVLTEDSAATLAKTWGLEITDSNVEIAHAS